MAMHGFAMLCMALLSSCFRQRVCWCVYVCITVYHCVSAFASTHSYTMSDEAVIFCGEVLMSVADYG